MSRTDKWTVEEIETVRKYWLAGETAREISSRLPGRTRNAVISILNRLRGSKKYAPLNEQVRQFKLPKEQRLRFKKIKPATKAHPLVRRLIELMNEEQCEIETLCKKVGISRTTFTQWRTIHTPRLDIIEACFTYFGRKLIDVPVKEKDDER